MGGRTRLDSLLKFWENRGGDHGNSIYHLVLAFARAMPFSSSASHHMSPGDWDLAFCRLCSPKPTLSRGKPSLLVLTKHVLHTRGSAAFHGHGWRP